jgi:hypothetical protein
MIIWPLYIDYSPVEWEKQAKKEYCERIREIGKETILINSMDSYSHGGVLKMSKEGKIVQEVKMDSNEMLYTYL